MDKYLEMFSTQLDEAIKPETPIPAEKVKAIGWYRRKCIARRNSHRRREDTLAASHNSSIMYSYPKMQAVKID